MTRRRQYVFCKAIHQQRLCNNGHQMTLSTVSDRWRCNARQCRQEIGLRKGTWLERSRMEFRTVILFIYFWSKNLATIKFCTEEVSIGHTTAVDWKNFLREICAWRLLQTPTIVGGPGLHIEINETLISRRKNHAGRVLPQQWIFGGICRETKEVFMYAVLPAQSPLIWKLCGSNDWSSYTNHRIFLVRLQDAE